MIMRSSRVSKDNKQKKKKDSFFFFPTDFNLPHFPTSLPSTFLLLPPFPISLFPPLLPFYSLLPFFPLIRKPE